MNRITMTLLLLCFTAAGCTAPQQEDEPATTQQQTSRSAGNAAGERSAETASTEQVDQPEAQQELTPEEETQMANTNAPDDVAAPPEDATTTDSGLAYKILEEGEGDSPSKTDTVRVHYTGWTTDGKKFDSSHDRGKPAEFPLNRVIAGWTEGVSLMKEGEKRRLWIPEELAYQGRPGAPQGMLVFDVELLEIVD